MSDLVLGKDVLVFQLIDLVYYQIGCATSCSFEFVNEIINKTSRNSSGFREKVVRLSDCRGTVTGLVKTGQADDILSIFWFLEQGQRRIKGTYKFLFTDEDSNEKSITLEAIVARVEMRGPAEGFAEFDLELEGTGGTTEDEEEPPGESFDSITSDTFTISGGEIQDDRLIDAQVIEVCREGTELTSMNVNYVFNDITGVVTPDSATTIDGQKLFVIWIY